MSKQEKKERYELGFYNVIKEATRTTYTVDKGYITETGYNDKNAVATISQLLKLEDKSLIEKDGKLPEQLVRDLVKAGRKYHEGCYSYDKAAPTHEIEQQVFGEMKKNIGEIMSKHYEASRPSGVLKPMAGDAADKKSKCMSKL